MTTLMSAGNSIMASQFLFSAFSFLALSSVVGVVKSLQSDSSSNGLSLVSLRELLTREEDTIVFCLIERAKYPYNSPAYDPSYPHFAAAGDSCSQSIIEVFIRDTEAIQAKAGRYQSPEEVPFFPGPMKMPILHQHFQDLYPAAAFVNVSSRILKMYFDQLLPLFTAKGDDGNYALTAAADLACLQALSRRIHYGRYVAEVKFKDSAQDYAAAILAKDKDTLMKLLTNQRQEELVIRRVEEKAKVFGQQVALVTKAEAGENNDIGSKYKVDPLVVHHLYGDWIIPLTKVVEVEYLLHRLD